MDRVFEYGAIGSAPSAPASPSSGYPTAGNPSTATPATKPGPYWFHQVTEELRAVIVGAGLMPDHEDLSQLKEAIDTLIDAGKGLGSSGVVLLNTTATLTNSAHVGKTVLFDGKATGAFTVTLPMANAVVTGKRIQFMNVSNFSVTVQRQGSNVIHPNNGAGVNSILVGPGDTLVVEAYSGVAWLAVGGSSQLGASSSFGSLFTYSGYQKLPSGLIIQWGLTGHSANNVPHNVSYPISFPTACLSICAIPYSEGVETTEDGTCYIVNFGQSTFRRMPSGFYTNSAFIAIGF